MTLDSARLYRPTESLVLPTHRKFFPFKIPNSHHQLRHYISTVDPDRIYVAVERVIYAIHISSLKRDIITIVPFEPKCLAAGFGWIGIGGSEHGDCAFIRIADPASHRPRQTASHADVDTPLPLDLDATPRRLRPWAPEVQIHEFGGSIVNSVTIHRLPGDNDVYAHEDVAILSNNDTTVNIYSLTRSEIIKTIRHPIFMNYAIISPDSKVLAAVGDENRIYFYRVVPCFKSRVPLPNENKMLRGWEWPLIRCVELDSNPIHDDRCCFTIAFSPSSHLCAVGSQAGLITVFDVKSVLDTDSQERRDRDEIVCVFQSSRSDLDGGAVRCMTFSPRPWDLLVWVEDHGRAGIADVRQAFCRRQILKLDLHEPGLQQVRTESLIRVDHAEGSDSESENRPSRRTEGAGGRQGRVNGTNHLVDIMEDSAMRRAGEPSGYPESQAMRESLLQDLTDRERQIIDFLNTARWTSSIEEGPPSRLPRSLSPLPYSDSTSGAQGGNHSPLPSSPSRDTTSARYESIGDRTLDRARAVQPRRRSSVVLSQENSVPSSQLLTANAAPHPTITLRWIESPSQISLSNVQFDAGVSNSAGPRAPTPDNPNGAAPSSGDRGQDRTNRTRVLFDGSLGQPATNTSGQRQRPQRSRSIPRRSDRPDTAIEAQDSQEALSPELRTALATERLRLQRQAAVEESHRLTQWEQQYRRLLDSPRWIRSALGEMPDRNPVQDVQDEERGVGTAGVGWGEDGRTLYIGTVEGIFQYQVNVQDRKTFPGFSCR